MTVVYWRSAWLLSVLSVLLLLGKIRSSANSWIDVVQSPRVIFWCWSCLVLAIRPCGRAFSASWVYAVSLYLVRLVWSCSICLLVSLPAVTGDFHPSSCLFSVLLCSVIAASSCAARAPKDTLRMPLCCSGLMSMPRLPLLAVGLSLGCHCWYDAVAALSEIPRYLSDLGRASLVPPSCLDELYTAPYWVVLRHASR